MVLLRQELCLLNQNNSASDQHSPSSQHLQQQQFVNGTMRNKHNVLWHIRTGDICLHCDNQQYYENIHSFLLPVVEMVPTRYILMHQNDPHINELFMFIKRNQTTTNLEILLYMETDSQRVIQTIVECDIVISSGSSFVNNILWFTMLHQPVILQPVIKEVSISPNNAKVFYGVPLEKQFRCMNEV